MTKQEFTQEWERLQKEFPAQFQSVTRKDLIAKHVISLEVGFWRALVDRMILSNNPRLDIEEAARSERLSRFNQRLAKDAIGAYEVVSQKMTEDGFRDALNKFGATSVWEAIERNKLK